MMRTVFVDYNRVGHATRFRTQLFRSEREGLLPDDEVLVTGDAVPDRVAHVIEVDDTGAVLEFDRPLANAS
ncbi:MAG: hypothetical protein WKF86_05010 [Acidimicrobiales bacterium]